MGKPPSPPETLILLLVGEKCAGKTSAVRFLKKLYGDKALLVRHGDLVPELTNFFAESVYSDRGFYPPKTLEPQENERIVAELRRLFGPHALSRALKQKLEVARLPRIVLIDGADSLEDLRLGELAHRRVELRIVHIGANADARYAHYREDCDVHGKTPLSREAFLRLANDAGSLARAFERSAHVFIENEDSEEAFRAELVSRIANNGYFWSLAKD